VNHVNRNLVWLLLSQLATWSVSLVVILVVPHFLGAANFGEFSFAYAYVNFFVLAGSFGTSAYITRELARNHSLLTDLVVNGIAQKTCFGIVLTTAAVGLGRLFGFDDLRMTLVVILCVGMVFQLWNEVLASALNGMQWMGKMSGWFTLGVYASSILGIVVLARDGGVVAYTLAVTAAGTITVFANFFILLPHVRGHRWRLDNRVARALVAGGAPLMLLMIFNQVYNTIDVPLLARLTSTTVVGWYGLAYRWAAIPIFIATAVIGSHYPEMSKLGHAGGGPKFANLVNRALKLNLLAAIPAAVGLAVIAPNLIEAMYDQEFDGTTRPLQILALQIPITGMDTILATALIASDRLRRYLWVAGFAAVANPLLCAFLITVADRTWQNGAIGAATATALTELFVMTCALHMRADGVMNRSLVLWTLRCTLAGVAIIPVAALARDSIGSLVAQIAVGGALFTLAALALRVIPIAMLRDGLRLVSSRLLGRPASSDQDRDSLDSATDTESGRVASDSPADFP
jgi:O-antigen/teichoic acid export membrane protein